MVGQCRRCWFGLVEGGDSGWVAMASVCFGLLLVDDDGASMESREKLRIGQSHHVSGMHCRAHKEANKSIQDTKTLNKSIGTEGKYIVYPRIYAKKWYTTKHKCNKITKRRNRNTRAANVKQNRENKKEHASVRWRSVEHLLLPREGGKQQSLLQGFVQTSTYPNFSPTLMRWPFSMFQFHPP